MDENPKVKKPRKKKDKPVFKIEVKPIIFSFE